MSELALARIRENKKTKSPSLNLASCGLTTLPEELFDCVWLEELIVSNIWIYNRDTYKWEIMPESGPDNLLTELPKGISRLINLKILNLGGGGYIGDALWTLSDLSGLSSLSQLEWLDLSQTEVSDLSGLSSLSQLEWLGLGETEVSDLSCLSSLVQLKRLDLSHTEVSDLSCLSSLSQLEWLDLSHTGISDLSGLSSLVQLKTLDLWGTSVSDFSGLSSLVQLKRLNLRDTSVSDLSGLSSLFHLETLNLWGTSVSDLSGLSSFVQLRTLNLWGTSVSDLSGLSSLVQLKTLNLWGTSVSDLSGLSSLSHLETLDLSYTSVSDLSGLSSLSQLKRLDLSHTELSDISPILPIIQKGIPVRCNKYMEAGIDQINLYGNPLIHPPVEIVKEGNEAILNYFRELEEGEETVYEAKLLIIGEAGTGKTTFSRKIRDSHAAKPKEVEDTTRGIDIIPHTFHTEGKPDFLMKIWDFGGQDVYHGIHQLFLSKRSLYVLLLDGRLEENPHYWLQAQELFGKGSPLLVVLNKKGSIRQDRAVNELRSEYNNLKSYHEINLLEDLVQVEDMSRLVETHIRTLPHFKQGEKLPKKWVAIRSRLEKEAERDESESTPCRNHINLERFQEICESEGIKEWDRQDFLSDYLHDLGVLLHFSDEPQLKKILFLNPQWATDAIYRVLDHTKEQEKSGYFKHEDLNELWHEASYRNVFEELLALMEQFELCFPVTGKDSFIVPQLLPADKPEGYSWQEEEGELALRYQYDFLPKGIVPRVVVRLHTLLASNEIFWKRGALFEREGAIAEVVEHFRDKYIHVRVKGRNRRRLLTIIAHQIDEINRTFHFSERMNVHQLIPCNCRECRGKKPSYFRMSHIQHAINRKKKEIECPQSFDNVIVASLLEETFWQDGTYKSYDVLQPLIKRVDYVRQLLADGQIKAALQELGDGMKSGDHAHEVLAHLSSYESIQNGIRAGTMSQEQQRLEINRLIQAASELSYRLAEEYPEKAQIYIKISHPLPDPVTTKGDTDFSSGSGHTINIYGNVGSLISDNKAPFTQSIDQRD